MVGMATSSKTRHATGCLAAIVGVLFAILASAIRPFGLNNVLGWIGCGFLLYVAWRAFRQYRWQMLYVAITASVLFAVWAIYQYNLVQRRRDALEMVPLAGKHVTRSNAPWRFAIFGEKDRIIELKVWAEATEEEFQRIQRLFSEARVIRQQPQTDPVSLPP